MKFSASGIGLLENQLEGCILYPYDDADKSWPRKRIEKGQKIGGYPTIGIGHVIHEGEDLWRDITRDEAEALLVEDLQPKVACVNRNVTVAINQHQFDALVIFTFNVGEGQAGFAGSTLLKMVNAERWDDCPAAFALFNKSRENGVLAVNPGLVKRRANEAALFMTPMPVDPVDTSQVLASVYEMSARMVGELVGRDLARSDTDPAPPHDDVS